MNQRYASEQLRERSTRHSKKKELERKKKTTPGNERWGDWMEDMQWRTRKSVLRAHTGKG